MPATKSKLSAAIQTQAKLRGGQSIKEEHPGLLVLMFEGLLKRRPDTLLESFEHITDILAENCAARMDTLPALYTPRKSLEMWFPLVCGKDLVL